MRNIRLKLLSLAGGIVAWVFVNSDANITVRTMTVPVDYRNVSTEKVIISEINKEVKVTIRGPSFLVSRLESSPPVFKVLIPGDVSNRHIVTLRKEDLDIQFPLQVTEIDPDEFEVRFDNRLTKSVPVQVQKTGELPNNLEVSQLKVSPDRVSLVGAESVLRRTREVFTEQLDLSKLDVAVSGETVDIPLKLVPVGTGVAMEPNSQVDVTVAVSAPPIRKVIRRVPVAVLLKDEEAKSLVAEPSVVTVEVSGDPGILHNLDADDLSVKAKVDSSSPSKTPISLTAILPNDVSIVSISPAAVQIRARKR